MKKMDKQKGFTIIELVVVILLLGILTATALPRFMDVTDEAHSAVVDGTLAGLSTGVAMFHAQWVANGEPVTAISEFGSQFANANGYPVGVDTGADNNVLDDNEECESIFINLLQGGAPAVTEDASETASAAIDQANITAAAGSDFLAQFTAANTCTYAYIAQFNTMASQDIPTIVYDASTGSVTIGGDL